MATKQDIINIESKIDRLEERIERKILQSEYRFIINLGAIVIIAMAAATAVIKLL